MKRLNKVNNITHKKSNLAPSAVSDTDLLWLSLSYSCSYPVHVKKRCSTSTYGKDLAASFVVTITHDSFRVHGSQRIFKRSADMDLPKFSNSTTQCVGPGSQLSRFFPWNTPLLELNFQAYITIISAYRLCRLQVNTEFNLLKLWSL